MIKHTLSTGLFALIVAGAAGVPLAAQTTETAQPAVQVEEVSDRADKGVAVQVRNDSWSTMRIYLVEVGTQKIRRRLGTVDAVSAARFEIPNYLGAESSNLVLVAVAMASGEQHTTDHLLTWPGSIVDWRLGPTVGLSYASVF